MTSKAHISFLFCYSAMEKLILKLLNLLGCFQRRSFKKIWVFFSIIVFYFAFFFTKEKYWTCYSDEVLSITVQLKISYYGRINCLLINFIWKCFASLLGIALLELFIYFWEFASKCWFLEQKWHPHCEKRIEYPHNRNAYGYYLLILQVVTH